MKRLRGHLLPLLMCVLTVATVGLYSHAASYVGEYNFLVRADKEGISRIRADLEFADLRDFEAGEVEGGLYRVTVRCPRGKIASMLGVINSHSGREEEK